MSDWTAGYTADIGYTFGYFHEFNPSRARLAFVSAGLVPSEGDTHCELGFGQGISAVIHAAASGHAWYGTDFNPAQAGFAQSLAKDSGANAKLFDEAFADFCARPDLPDFDSIGLHGIWSWISDENRAVIADFVSRKLKVGGVLYVSYNTQPGFAAMIPLRDLMTQHAAVMSAPGAGTVRKVDEAVVFAEKFMAMNPAYATANPQVATRLEMMKDKPRNYLAHEYFNKDWLPMSFYKMAEWLAPAKLGFACSALYLDHIDLLNLSTQHQEFINAIPDPMFRQTLRDFCVNQQFRRDYWVKGARRLSVVEQAETLRAQKIALLMPAAKIKLKVSGTLGEAELAPHIYTPILEALDNFQIRSLGEIEQAVKANGITFPQLQQAVMILIGSGQAATIESDEAVVRKARETTDALNRAIINKARGSADIVYLASPLTGGAIEVQQSEQLLLLAYIQGAAGAQEMASEVWKHFSAQGVCVIKDGKPLASAEENIAAIALQAKDFLKTRLPLFKALQVV